MISIDRNSFSPLYRQIYDQLRLQIMNGSLDAGSKLPSIRRLGEELGISRNTVEAAYLQLSSEGYVLSRVGSGFVVEALELKAESRPSQLQKASQKFLQRLAYTTLWPLDQNAQSQQATRVSPDNAADATTADSSSQPVRPYDFTYGNLEPFSFPTKTWRKLMAEVLATDKGSASASTYSNNLGFPQLRQQIANYLHNYAGVNCHPAQIVIQAGTQNSMQNLLTLFDPIRDVIGMEEPGYDGVRAVFENNRFRLFPLPVTEGHYTFLNNLYKSHARLVYVTPSNQFPTGTILPLSERQRLINWANEANAYIIEDDYCREYRYRTSPLPSLQSLDQSERVIYMGTFSKSISPALRISYLVLPPELLFEWNRHFQSYYSEVPWINQAVLAAFMEYGYWEKHLHKMQTMNRRKHQALLAALKEFMGDRVEVLEKSSGLHILIGDRQGRDQEELIQLAGNAGVSIYGTNRYWIAENHPMQNFVLIGFSAIREQDIRPGIAGLAKAWYPEGS